jgi:ferredoxin--NADP+ reductase
MKLSDYEIGHRYPATLLSSERLTSPDSGVEVRHLVLKMPETDFDFIEGQSVGVLAPGPHEFGNPHHLRLYSVASSSRGEAGRDTISICVRRCFYVDEVSGERYPGKASNYLCDARPGDTIEITGPYGAHFKMPPDPSCHMLMVGAGTGIAPFRAFVRRIFEEKGGWTGKVRLFYGAKTGMEMLYLNDLEKDMALYYDEKSFQAFEAVSSRPILDSTPALDRLILDHRAEVWSMIQDPKTYVYVAGLSAAIEKFQKAMVEIAGSEEAWQEKRRMLVDQRRYAELVY